MFLFTSGLMTSGVTLTMGRPDGGATQNTEGFKGQLWPQHHYTLANWPAPVQLPPPESGLPQVTTEPSARIAANA